MCLLCRAQIGRSKLFFRYWHVQKLAAISRQLESRLLLVRRQRLVARIRLHLALGGGFQAPESTPEEADPDDGSPEDAP